MVTRLAVRRFSMAEIRHCPHCGAALPSDAPEGVCPQCFLGLGLGSRPESQPDPSAAVRSGPPTTPYRPDAKFVAPEPAVLAKHFPQLEILELLGQGGMGAVYKARQPRLNRLVALKILPAEVAADPAFSERFAREAQALAQLTHPNIVAVHDFGEAGGLYYFLMEYVDGVDLRQMLRTGQLRPQEALAIVPQICQALQFAHDEGIVHRDIKPENILLDKKGRVKIADFGLAKLLGRPPSGFQLTGSQQVMGTPHYMAPEQMERPQAVDHRADIYSLGVVFYEMLTGELPLGRFAPPSRKVQVDVRLDEVVLRTLEKEPEQRYQHAGDVKTDVERISHSPGLEPPSPAVGKPAETDLEEARAQVRGPAIGLLIVGVFHCLVLLPLLSCGAWYFVGFTQVRPAQPGFQIEDRIEKAGHGKAPSLEPLERPQPDQGE
jgi:serine/threonine protein kinase